MGGDFVDLIAWQEADQLQGEIHRLADKLRGPGAYKAADQMRRAAESIASNIAEGYGRRSPADFARFLKIASGSAVELESQIRSCVTNRRLRQEEITRPLARTRRTRALVRGLENWLEKQIERVNPSPKDASAATRKPRRADPSPST